MEIININSQPASVHFKRRLQPAEVRKCKSVVQEGLKVLNKEVGIIIHNSTAPALGKFNTGIGSLLSITSMTSLIPLLANNGVTKIQQEPDGLRRSWTLSPYAPLTTGKNIYMIPLEKLATEEYGTILPVRVFNSVVGNRPNKLGNRVDYNYVKGTYDAALKVAYSNFLDKHYEIKDPAHPISKLAVEFEEYKAKNSKELEPQALYEILSNQYGTDNWKDWNKTDRNLYNIRNPQQASSVLDRLTYLRKAYAKDIDFYFFKQMVAEREIAFANKANAELGISIIGDSPIAFTPVEEWQNQDLFLEDFALGCPPDFFSADGQRWGFSVLKPETIFNPDGSLGEGGKLMQRRYEKMFEASSGGARIDHVIGLIDPFVYSTKEPKMTDENSGRLYSSPNHKILGKYAKTTDEEYAAILTKIVIPAAEKYGLTKDDIICEDLGEVTAPVARVMEQLNLSGIAVTQFDYRGKDAEPDRVIMLGSHDNPSYIEYTRDLFKYANKSKNNKARFDSKTDKLAEDTLIPGDRKWFYRHKIRRNPNEFMKAAFTELFISPAKRVQIFFTDFFGMGETYNIPGQTENCWDLRMPNDIEGFYHERLSEDRGFNIPEIIARAIRVKNNGTQGKHAQLLEQLDKFAKILKE